MPRSAGSKNRSTLAAMQAAAVARRRLRKLYGADPESGGIAPSTLDTLLELTRNVYEPPVRLGAAKELAAFEYTKPKPVAVHGVTGEVLEEGGAGEAPGTMQVELWSDGESVSA